VGQHQKNQEAELAAGLTILFVLILPIVAFCVPTIATFCWVLRCFQFQLQHLAFSLRPLFCDGSVPGCVGICDGFNQA
jgi:hypothetical protein